MAPIGRSGGRCLPRLEAPAGRRGGRIGDLPHPLPDSRHNGVARRHR
jgi:hypothetical protein